jgi:biopolymer transport protein ExbB
MPASLRNKGPIGMGSAIGAAQSKGRCGIGNNRAPRPSQMAGDTRLLSIIQAAGWPIWPLVACSIVALALILERLYHLRAPLVAPPKLLEEVVSVTRASLPTADVVNKLAENAVIGDPRVTEPVLRQSFESAGRSAVHKLERYLNTLGTIAAAAPLLGLFGTVVGMIEIFGSQSPGAAGAGAGNNPQQLAHGISVALYNTAFGLIIAIPSLMFYRYFRGRVDEFQLGMELAAERMVPHLMRFAVRG